MPVDAISSEKYPLKTINSIATRHTSPGGLMFCSGAVGFDKDIKVSTLAALNQLKEVLQLGGSSLDKVLKYNIYLLTMDDFDGMNEVFAEFTPPPKPARTCIQAAKLPRGGFVEIECIASL